LLEISKMLGSARDQYGGSELQHAPLQCFDDLTWLEFVRVEDERSTSHRKRGDMLELGRAAGQSASTPKVSYQFVEGVGVTPNHGDD